MLALRQAVRFLQSQLHIYQKQLKNEEYIESQTKISSDIHSMTLTDLRKALISTGFAYKGERMRTEEFQRKFDGALLQLQRREEVADKLEETREKN